MKPRVYIVQNQLVYNHDLDRHMNKDYSDAKRFGEVTVLLDNTATPFDLPPLMQKLHDTLKDITLEDWFIPVGNPVLIGLVIAVAAEYLGGKLKMLQWSGSSRSYIPITVETNNGSKKAAA